MDLPTSTMNPSNVSKTKIWSHHFPCSNSSLDFCHSWDKHRDPCCGSRASAASSVVVFWRLLSLAHWVTAPFTFLQLAPKSYLLHPKELYSGCSFLLLDIFFPPLGLPWLTQLLKRHILGKHPSAESSDLLTFPVLNTYACVCSVTSVVSDSATPWTVARQAPLCMGFSRKEHWSGWPRPPPGDLPHPESHVSCTGRQVSYH